MSLLIETWRNDDPDAPAARRFMATATTTGKKPASLRVYGATREAVRGEIEAWQTAEQAKAKQPRVPAKGKAEALHG